MHKEAPGHQPLQEKTNTPRAHRESNSSGRVWPRAVRKGNRVSKANEGSRRAWNMPSADEHKHHLAYSQPISCSRGAILADGEIKLLKVPSISIKCGYV